MTCRILASAATAVPADRIADEQIVVGAPTAGVLDFDIAEMPCGLWEHSAGSSTDVEVDEVFVVLSGHARIEILGQESLEVGPGDIVHLIAGARTTWHVGSTLRKFWVTPAQ